MSPERDQQIATRDKPLTDKELALMALSRRQEVRQALTEAVQRSVTSAADSGRTVEDPRKAAEYVVNMLTMYDTTLLVAAARVFGEVER